MSSVFLGVGSNLDNPTRHVLKAFDDLTQLPMTAVVKASSLYHTAPMNNKPHPSYINAVVAIETSLDPPSLLSALNEIERLHGRIRSTELHAPRPLDLDILLYGNLDIKTEKLSIPHPGIYERSFVLIPLFEIASELILPNGEPIRVVITRCSYDGIAQLSEVEIRGLMNVD